MLAPLVMLGLLSWGCANDETTDGHHHAHPEGGGGAAPSLDLDPAPPLEVDSKANDLRAVVAPLLDAKWVSGGVIVAVRPDGAGFAPVGALSAKDAAAPSDDTLYELGSVSKTFVGLLFADAVNKGELTPETLLSEVLPSDVTVPSFQGTPIELRELTTHTSGLPRDIVDPTPKNWSKLTPDVLYAKLAHVSLEHEPGSTFSYSNLGAGLLGHALGLRKEVAFDDVLASDIATPLGLPDTTSRLTDEQHARVALPQTADFAPEAEIELVALNGAGAIRSTGRDMAQYLQVQLGQKESVLSDAVETSHQPMFAITSKWNIAYGWFLPGDGTVFHDGLTWGHTSCVMLDPAKGTAVAFLTNVDYPSFAEDVPTMQDICGALLAVVEGGSPSPVAAPPLVAISSAVQSKYIGTYSAGSQGNMDITLGEDGELHAGFGPGDEPRLWPATDTKFGVRTYASWMTFASDGSTMKLSLYDGTTIDFDKLDDTLQLRPATTPPKRFAMPPRPVLDIPHRERR